MRILVPRPIQAGFTLVELLIVVIILAVLAAIIVPQFSSSTIDAKEAALDANLARLRSSIELFHAARQRLSRCARHERRQLSYGRNRWNGNGEQRAGADGPHAHALGRER
jgi:prepilin-type N-terminal cleavage/methylation domain-containing protein